MSAGRLSPSAFNRGTAEVNTRSERARTDLEPSTAADTRLDAGLSKDRQVTATPVASVLTESFDQLVDHYG